MKSKQIYTSLLSTFCFSLFAISGQAQTGYHAGSLMQEDLNGTARFISMGGALGALGADVTTSSTNPAGTAIIRQSDASITLGGLITGNPAALSRDKSRMSLDQAGVVFVLGKSDTGMRNLNFAVNFRKNRNSLENLSTMMNYGGLDSQTEQLAWMSMAAYMEMDAHKGDPNYDSSQAWGLLPDLATIQRNEKTGQISWHGIVYDNVSEEPSKEEWENVTSGRKAYELVWSGADKGAYQRFCYGSNSEVDINASVNYEDKIFIGASIGIYTQDLVRESIYEETFSNGAYYRLSNTYSMKSTGVDGKLGIIVRPFESSPFRLGLSVHTPIWYTMKDYNTVHLDASDGSGQSISDGRTPGEAACRLRTPWVVQASLGHTFGSFLAVGLEYEYRNLRSSKFSPNAGGGGMPESNSSVKNVLKEQHTIKAGVEIKPVKNLALRLGYNYVTSPYQNGAYYSMPYYTTYTETDYTNWGDIHRITAGIGYKIKRFYLDIAYQNQLQKGDFYPYCVNENYGNDGLGYGANLVPPVKVSNNRSQIVATLGFRF